MTGAASPGDAFFKAELRISHGALRSSGVEPESPRGLREGVTGNCDDPVDSGDADFGSGSQLVCSLKAWLRPC